MHRRFVVVLLIFALRLSAAEPTGSIAGTVLDSSGAPIAKARIGATNTATGLNREALSATDGGYVFPLLPVGPYSVTVEAPGFRRFEQRGITVTADANVNLPVTLQVGEVTETVTVEAQAALVETRSGTLGQVVNEQKIIELPLNGRNAATLVLLSPGTADLEAGNARGAGDVTHSADYPGAQAISSNGGRSEGVNYLLDGASNLDPWTNVNNPFPNPDALEEFSVQTNSYSAEYGRAAGAVVNIVTKSGTNQFHGSAFEFLRNGAMNARNFFAPVPDHLKRNQFGGAVGGPILKDRLFFFGTYQGTRLRNIATGISTFVLTPAQRAGDFSGTSRKLVDPASGQLIPGNMIPASRIDPATLKLLPLIPISTSPDGRTLFDRPAVNGENQVMLRGDYNLNRQRIYVRYFRTKQVNQPMSGQVNLVASGPGFTYFDQGVSFSHTFTQGPNLLNNFIFSYNRNDTNRVSAAPFGVDKIGVNIAQPPIPEISLSVSGFFSISTGRQGEFDRPAYDFSDSVHWIHGVHEFSFGGDVQRIFNDVNNTFRQSGDFRFRGTTYSGNAASDFMLGWLDRFIQGGGDYRSQRGTQVGLFVQDNMRLSRRLNLNIGLRWDPWIPYGDGSGRIPCWVPGAHSTRYPNAPPGYLLAGDAGCPGGGTTGRMTQFGPRLGLAYNLDGGRTVIRAGAGIFYQPPFFEALGTLTNSAPFSPQFMLFGVPFDNPWVGQVNPFPASYGPGIPGKDVQFSIPVGAVSLSNDWRPPRIASWNLAVERQLSKDVLVRVAYAASKGTFLGYNVDLNAAIYGPGANGSNTQTRRPNQNFQGIVEDIAGGNSNYNSLQLTFEKRFSAGFNVSANYTYGKSIDQVSYLTDTCSTNTINPFNVGAYRAVSDYNVPQRFVLNYLWALPSFKGHGALTQVIGDWQTTGIWNWQSGFPLTITAGEDDALSGVGNDLADVTGKPSLTSGPLGARINQWFTTGVFKTAAPGTFGNVGRNILQGPGTFNLDFSIQKLFSIRENWKLQYRAEFFNGLNHTLLNNPSTTVTSASFGRITGARDPRILQMALKLRF
ncbi:MAG TPA: TonB-dependent receptor [Bryobacterales bacterium]|nr:TonB-dependent receptor [Bryobacterales bacterium]